MIGLISRLTDQKGLDLINHVIEGIVDDFTQLVVIGTGDPQYENMFRHYAWKYPDRVSANICYSDDLAHKLYAAADAFLMPSRFEPCGLTQLISFRYGTVPIVRETGGLKDTVKPYNEYEIQEMDSHSPTTMLMRCLQSSIILSTSSLTKSVSGTRLWTGAWLMISLGMLRNSNMRDYTITLLVNKIFW